MGRCVASRYDVDLYTIRNEPGTLDWVLAPVSPVTLCVKKKSLVITTSISLEITCDSTVFHSGYDYPNFYSNFNYDIC